MDVEKLIASLSNRTVDERRLMRERAEVVVTAGDPVKAGGAARLVQSIDDLERAETDALIEHVRALPKTRRVIEAFSHPPMTDTERAVVQVLLENPRSTSTQLSAALGWKAQAWHMHFGTMCFNRRSRLWPAPPSESREAAFYSGILADFDASTSTFTMMREAAEGFAALGIVVSSESGARPKSLK